MPLVFVHGVNVRKGKTEKEQEDFAESVRRRDDLFRKVGLAGLVAKPALLQIENPYWGDLGARFRFNLASIPAEQAQESFGTGEELMARVLQETLPPTAAAALKEAQPTDETFVLTLARSHSLAVAVDSLVTASALDVEEHTPGDALAAFAALALRYAEANPKPSWLQGPRTDNEFVDRLLLEVQPAPSTAGPNETFGGIALPEGLKRAARKLGRVARATVKATVDATMGIVRGAIGAVVGGAGGVVGGTAIAVAPGTIVGALRPVATRRAGLFFGDVFAYLAHRKPIQDIILEALLRAAQNRNDADPLVVVAHSMGGNIVYDLLTSVLADSEFHVDALVTVGSQVGLFKELALYAEDGTSSVIPELPAERSPAKVPKPESVGTWINVFDPIDVLGFAAAGVFEEVRDFAFSNETSPLDAHTLYFFRPRFHHRLRARLVEAGVIRGLE